MSETGEKQQTRSRRFGWILLTSTIAITLIVVVIAVNRVVVNPRTDDAEVFANYIGIAPQVEGPIVHLAVRDNQEVHKGELLFEIDDRPYIYALERAQSEQATLEGQIEDLNRRIESQKRGANAAQANVEMSAAARDSQTAAVAQAQANLAEAEAQEKRAEADRDYALHNLQRLEPLLAQHYVTTDDVDRARTLLETRSRAVEEAKAHVGQMQAQITGNRAQVEQSSAAITQSVQQQKQAESAVETLAPLSNQRQARAAAVRLAQYNLNNCRVYAPFDAFVTNLTISEGQYAHTGTQVFTLIDARIWWVVADFRETQLRHIVQGDKADVFVMMQQEQRILGVVESIDYGVTADPSVLGVQAPGLPNIERSLSWVHLAARYPVRIRVVSPPRNLLRVGETAVAVVHPTAARER
jgi:membrane fusion protein, multidrug efflux system